MNKNGIIFETRMGVIPYKIYGEQDSARGLRWIYFARTRPLIFKNTHDIDSMSAWIGRYYLPI